MAQSATESLVFAGPAALPLTVDFTGGRLTSDGGLPWLAEADAALGLCAALAAVIPDWRTRRGRHDLPPCSGSASTRLPAAMRIRTTPTTCAVIRC